MTTPTDTLTDAAHSVAKALAKRLATTGRPCGQIEALGFVAAYQSDEAKWMRVLNFDREIFVARDDDVYNPVTARQAFTLRLYHRLLSRGNRAR
jgi:hypothetical protein